MEKVFINDINDKGLSILLKREANIMLASLNKNSFEYLVKKEHFKNTINVVKEIERSDPQNESDIEFIINTINRIWKIGILSPLTLKEDEFSTTIDRNGYRHNLRYYDIYINTRLNNSICNGNAFNIFVRASYSNNSNKQLDCTNYILNKNTRIYISKGGIITGEYVETCIIRPDIVNKHLFTIQSIVNIPVCSIKDNDTIIYCVDHREPKLKSLQKFYDIPIYKDDYITNKHYNIRKYDKLK